MAALRINLPDEIKAIAESRASESGRKIDDYLSELIRADADQELDSAVEAQLVAGIESGPGVEVDSEFWRQLRDRARNGSASRGA